MTESLWKNALEESEVLRKHLQSQEFRDELEKITGKSQISGLEPDSKDNEGVVSIWVSIALLRKRTKETEERVEMFDEDFEYIYDKLRDLEEQMDSFKDKVSDQRAETAEYIRDMTDRKYEAYQKLLESQETDSTQKKIAKDLEMDEAVLSRFKKEFKQNEIL